MRLTHPLLVCLLLGLGIAGPLALAPSTARAEESSDSPRDKARRLANRGYELSQEGRYEEANTYFREAEALFHAPTLVLQIAQTYEKLGRLADAEAMYEKLLAEDLPNYAPEPFRDAQDQARQELAALRPRVPTLDLQLSDRSAAGRVKVAIDGQPIPASRLGRPISVNPGEHTIEVSATGSRTQRRTLVFAEGRSEPFLFDLGAGPPEPDEQPEQSGSAAPAAVAFGIGGAGLVVGLVAGIIALDKESELEDRCPDRWCYPEDEELADSAETSATVSTVGLVAGAAGVAAGVVLLILSETGVISSSEEAAFSVQPGYRSVFIQGLF